MQHKHSLKANEFLCYILTSSANSYSLNYQQFNKYIQQSGNSSAKIYLHFLRPFGKIWDI